MAILLDLNDIATGKVELKTFQEKLDSLNWDLYAGQEVQIRGCAPTWAHLLVAGRLFGKIKKLEFLIDDRKAGVPVEVFRKS